MKPTFDQYILQLFSEAEAPSNASPTPNAAPENAKSNNGNNDLTNELENPDNFEDEQFEDEEEVSPEEIELAKLAVRALYFNIESKDVHNLKLHIDNRDIPFEKISDYFEKTKNIFLVIGFVEWVMDRYEGVSSKWSEEKNIKGKSIGEKIRLFNKQLPDEQKLDNGKRVYWTRIILNALLHGDSNFNLNISEVNEKNIKEIFRLLKQYFGSDTRTAYPSPTLTGDFRGPSTF